jgi:hypothetical protein
MVEIGHRQADNIQNAHIPQLLARYRRMIRLSTDTRSSFQGNSLDKEGIRHHIRRGREN